MRASQFTFATLKETPSDADIVSSQLMLRAGMIRKSASGLYTWLPMGLKTLQKVKKIIREEMDAINCQELLMPVVQSAELWQESGRWEAYGPELLRFKDRHQRDFVLGPTHEEVITDIARNLLKSYKQLPVSYYQIQTKFRDEIRPRFGVMRSREFIMKDAYSFHIDQPSLQRTYDDMYRAYHNIFTRLGLDFRAVQAIPARLVDLRRMSFKCSLAVVKTISYFQIAQIMLPILSLLKRWRSVNVLPQRRTKPMSARPICQPVSKWLSI